MVNYNLTIWPLIGGWDNGTATPAEVACLPEDDSGISVADEVVVLDVSPGELLDMAQSNRTAIQFEASSTNEADVRAAALTALNGATTATYGLHAGLANHRCTPTGCVPGGTAASYVFLITCSGSPCGDTAQRDQQSHLVLRYAASVTPAS